jgi:hypothetical protein
MYGSQPHQHMYHRYGKGWTGIHQYLEITEKAEMSRHIWWYQMIFKRLLF